MPVRRGPVLATVAVASFVQHAPLTFALVAAPAALRSQGAALWQVGLFALVFLPVVSQFLWAPAVERSRDALPGGWLGWIGSTTLGIAGVAAAAAMLDPVPADAVALILLLAAMAAMAGTQKIAAGGYAIDALPPRDRVFANAAMGGGGALGALAGTAGLTALLDAHGWASTLWVAAGGSAVLAGVPLFAPKAVAPRPAFGPPALLPLLRDPRVRRLLRLLPLLGLPVGLAYGMVQPRLVDAGLDLTQVGLVNGAGQVLAFAVAAPIVTRLVARRDPALVVRHVMMAAAGPFVLLGLGTVMAPPHLQAAVAVGSALAGLALLVAVALPTATALMARGRPGQAASELSAALCCFGIAVLAGAGASGGLADLLGHGSVLVAAAVCCIPGAWAAGRLGQPDRATPPPAMRAPP